MHFFAASSMHSPAHSCDSVSIIPAMIPAMPDDDKQAEQEGACRSPPHATPATRSHDETNISTSTDSAFFRSVLEEQSEAARNASRTNTAKGSKSAVETFGSGGMMSTDPLQGDEEPLGASPRVPRSQGDAGNPPKREEGRPVDEAAFSALLKRRK